MPAFEFDPAKDAANLAKHGVSLSLIRRAAWPPDLSAEDNRRDYGETRWYGFVRIDGRVHVTVFTVRGSVVRMISLRKANLREVRRYHDQLS